MTSPYPILSILGIVIGALTIAAFLIWVERRLLALWQDRYGPNRVGPFGLLQVAADAIKMFMKEDWIPPFADKPVFIVAPAIVFVTVLMSFAVVPVAPGIIVSDLNIGLLVLSGHVVAGSLQRRARRMVLRQQIRAGRWLDGPRRRC